MGGQVGGVQDAEDKAMKPPTRCAEGYMCVSRVPLGEPELHTEKYKLLMGHSEFY